MSESLDQPQTKLDQLNIDVVLHLLRFFKANELTTVRQISPIFDEAVQAKCRRHFRKYSLSNKSVDYNLTTTILEQIENIFTEIGPYVRELVIVYKNFCPKLMQPISEIIREKCCCLRSLDIHHRRENATLAIPNLSQVKRLKLMDCYSDELISKYLTECPVLQSLIVVSVDTNLITGECFMAVPKLKELRIMTQGIHIEHIWRYLESNQNIIKFQLELIDQTQFLDLEKLIALLPKLQDFRIRECTSKIEPVAFQNLQHVSVHRGFSDNETNIQVLLKVLANHNIIKSIELFSNLTLPEKQSLSQLSNLETLTLHTPTFDPEMVYWLVKLPKLNSFTHDMYGAFNGKTFSGSRKSLDLAEYNKLKHITELELWFPWKQKLVNVHEMVNVNSLLHLRLVCDELDPDELILLIRKLAKTNILKSIFLHTKMSLTSQLLDTFKLLVNLEYVKLLGFLSVEKKLLSSMKYLKRHKIANVRYSSYQVNRIMEFAVCNNENWRTVCKRL